MNAKKALNHNLSVFGWGTLFIWWSVVVTVHPITLGMGAMGTGLIMLGLNAIRLMNQIKPVGSSTVFGITFLAWGALDQARIMLGLPGGLSFALALFVIGINIWMTPLFNQEKQDNGKGGKTYNDVR